MYIDIGLPIPMKDDRISEIKAEMSSLENFKEYCDNKAENFKDMLNNRDII